MHEDEHHGVQEGAHYDAHGDGGRPAAGGEDGQADLHAHLQQRSKRTEVNRHAGRQRGAAIAIGTAAVGKVLRAQKQLLAGRPEDTGATNRPAVIYKQQSHRASAAEQNSCLLLEDT